MELCQQYRIIEKYAVQSNCTIYSIYRDLCSCFFFLFCQVVDGFSVAVIYLGSKWPLYGLIPNKENTSVLLGIEVPKLLLCSTFCCMIVLDMTRIKDIPKTLYANKNVKIIQKSNHKWSIFCIISAFLATIVFFFFQIPKML